VSIYLEKDFGLNALAGALLLLAIVNIRNAWDLLRFRQSRGLLARLRGAADPRGHRRGSSTAI
jgi:hypothetical protein